jgi:DNA-binding transcriptional ArsR family regulator
MNVSEIQAWQARAAIESGFIHPRPAANASAVSVSRGLLAIMRSQFRSRARKASFLSFAPRVVFHYNNSIDIEILSETSMMNEAQALDAFAALSQETRLRIVRLLVTAGPDGLSAGAIGKEMDSASSSRMSFHLSHLEHAGLVVSRREGRSIIYSAAFEALSDLIAFLMRDCCQGHPEVCVPAVAALSSRCRPAAGAKRVAHV